MTLDDELADIRRTEDDPRRARILEGALSVFLAYGYSRTTMDDIARAAELSRPALYLHFRNKAAIYRALAECVLARCAERTRQVLRGDGTLLERLDGMVEQALFSLMREVSESPHGDELVDMRSSLAGEVIEDWRRTMDAELATAIATEAARNGVDLQTRELTALDMAHTFFDALEGMKPRINDPVRHLEAARSAVRLIVAALRP